jgi:XRE family aerobic/anaerobic benzoate catabolism transcriptional regulator
VTSLFECGPNRSPLPRAATRDRDARAATSPRDAVDAVLVRLGERVRNLRAIRGMSRKALAHDAHVSERFLADLSRERATADPAAEARADALALPLAELVDRTRATRRSAALVDLLARLPAARLAEAQLLLESRFCRGRTMRGAQNASR